MSVRLGAFYGLLTGDTAAEKINYAESTGIQAVDIDLGSLLRNERELAAARARGVLFVSSIIIIVNALNTGKATEEEVLDEMEQAMALSARFDHPRIIVADYFGPNTPDLLSVDIRRDILKRLISASLDKCDDPAVGFLVEPMTRRDSSTFPNVESSVAFIKEMDTPRVKMLFDTYHLAADGYDCLKVLSDNLGFIGHIHLSDYDGESRTNTRPLPGGGKVDFGPVVKFLMNEPCLNTWIFEGGAWDDGMLSSLNYVRGLMG